MYRLFRYRLPFWASLPLMLPQALSLRRTAPRAPAAEGPRSGCADAVGAAGLDAAARRPLRLLGIGDSPLEGVGIARIEDTLTVQLAQALAARDQRPVQWRILARNGLTAHGTLQRLLPQIEAAAFDLILVSVGVNDVTALTLSQRFRNRLTELLRALRQHSPAARIVLLGVPPMQAFPLLPQPLRAWLGGRSRRLEAISEAVAAAQGALHSPVHIEPSPELFADDGFHPSSLGHARWAHEVLQRLDADAVQPQADSIGEFAQ